MEPIDSKIFSNELKCEDIFIQNNGKEIFLNRIYSSSKEIKKSIILAPGLGNNGNLFRLDRLGRCGSLKDNKSFANMLALEGFNVYLYHPGYAENIYNNYVSQYCRQSRYYGKRYKASSTLGIDEIVNIEMPMIIEYVHNYSQGKEISWIGYSMGGMIIYFYFAKYQDDRIDRVITIGSPFSGSLLFTCIVPFINFSNKFIKYTPKFLLQYNPGSLLFFNPLNINRMILQTFLEKVLEPNTASLEKYFSNNQFCGFSSQAKYLEFVNNLKYLKESKKFLFFFGSNDMIALPDNIFLVHQIISPDDHENLIEVTSSGHFDLIIGNNAKEKVWIPSVNWLNL
ncbi:MAG: alpha/beta fold hydrolase [Desulfobacterales bacterium]|nr:alpha/beta fold hydrolase [Desulfobacterales bacterium]MBF0398790.1 alpha/beta fold hydrolase [Desulfobacterales bacterium]